MEDQRVIYDVLVLGAGLAGLAAARELRKTDRHVCILEAQSRAGGRVHTVRMMSKDGVPGDKIVEAGAQWIHGKENSLYRIAAENNLISPELGEEACGQFIRDDGEVFDEDLVKKIDFKIGQILEECEQFVNNPLEKDISIREYLEQKFQEFLGQNSDICPIQGLQLLDWHIRFQIIDNSCWDLEDVGVNEWGKYSFNGESCQAHINVRNGFDKILEVIVKDIGEERILYNHEAVQIKWGEEIATVLCRDGQIFSAKYLIVTFPIGILREPGLFSPELPRDILEVVNKSLGYGTIDKIYLEFESPFWEDEFKGIQFVWTKDESHCSSIPNWIKWMTGFDLIDGNILQGWIGGPGAIEMEGLADEEIIRDCCRVLGSFLKKTIPAPSHFYW